ncbi:jacalin-related lectin 19 [Triticum aestivum]|nr:jacalin-related lectin 19-like [Triticum aestivum]
MEMIPTNTNTITKTELQHDHGGSTSAAPTAIAVENLLSSLAPPVFQCAAGHLVCSTCHGNLPDKKRCVSCFIKTGFSRCFIPTSYSRCHGVERILQSVRVACPYRCSAAKMVYHEREEHERTCPGKAGAMQKQGRVVKMGPCGGGGVDVWEMDVRGVDRIVKVVLWHSGAVDAISVLYERDGREEQTRHWGKPEGQRSEICLEPDEYLIGVKGNLGNFGGCFLLGRLTLIGNLRTFGPYGTREGPPFDLPAAGGKIVGFHGRSGGLLDALGTYVKMDD